MKKTSGALPATLIQVAKFGIVSLVFRYAAQGACPLRTPQHREAVLTARGGVVHAGGADVEAWWLRVRA